MADVKAIHIKSADGGSFRVRPMHDCDAVLIEKRLHGTGGELRSFFIRPADLPALIEALQSAASALGVSGNDHQSLCPPPPDGTTP